MTADQLWECDVMFRRFWQIMGERLNALSMDDPHDDYLLRLEGRVARLKREIVGLLLTVSDGDSWDGPCSSTGIVSAVTSAR